VSVNALRVSVAVATACLAVGTLWGGFDPVRASWSLFRACGPCIVAAVEHAGLLEDYIGPEPRLYHLPASIRIAGDTTRIRESLSQFVEANSARYERRRLPSQSERDVENLKRIAQLRPDFFLSADDAWQVDRRFLKTALASREFVDLLGANEKWYGLSFLLQTGVGQPGAGYGLNDEREAFDTLSEIVSRQVRRWRRERAHDCDFFVERPPSATRRLALVLSLLRKHVDLAPQAIRGRAEDRELARRETSDASLLDSGRYDYLFRNSVSGDIPAEVVRYVIGSGGEKALREYLDNEKWLGGPTLGLRGEGDVPPPQLYDLANTLRVIERLHEHRPSFFLAWRDDDSPFPREIATQSDTLTRLGLLPLPRLPFGDIRGVSVGLPREPGPLVWPDWLLVQKIRTRADLVRHLDPDDRTHDEQLGESYVEWVKSARQQWESTRPRKD
jgi:hypothetical protein